MKRFCIRCYGRCNFNFSSLCSTYKKQIDAVYNNIKIVVDGVQINPKDDKGNEIQPFISAGTTYLPVKAIADAFGKPVKWDPNTYTVYIGETPNNSKIIGIVDFNEFTEPYRGKATVKHTYYDNHYIEVRQTRYPIKNVFNGDATYLLKGEYKRLTAKFAVDDNHHGINDDEIVDIYGDGDKIYSSYEELGKREMGRGDSIISIDIDLIGVDELRIDKEDGVLYDVELERIQ